MEQEKSFEHFRSLLGLHVKVNLGGPESRVGRLLDVRSDYLALEAEKEGVIYYQLRHIKSITKFTKRASRDHGRARYYKYDNFTDVLRRLRFKWVKINRGGPQSVEGTISHIQDGNILLIVNDEIIYIPIFHVQSINHLGEDEKSSGKHKSSGKKSDKKSDKHSGKGSGRGFDRKSGKRTGRGSGRNSGKISGISSGRHSHKRSHKWDNIKDAYDKAHEESIEHFMYKDPGEGSKHSRSSKHSRHSRWSHRSMGSHHALSSKRSIDSGRSMGSKRSMCSERSMSSRRSMCSERSMGSRRSLRSERSMGSGPAQSMRSHPHPKHSGPISGTNDPGKAWFPKQFPKT